MDTLITLTQYVALASCLGAGLLILGALPYALGRHVGKRGAMTSLAALSATDKLRWRMLLAEMEARGMRMAVEGIRRKWNGGTVGSRHPLT